MNLHLLKHMEEGERLFALVNSESIESLLDDLSEWTARLYQIVEEGADECSGEELVQAKEINDKIIQKVNGIREELAREILKTRKGSDAVKAYQGK